jgi:hypothetical protein
LAAEDAERSAENAEKSKDHKAFQRCSRRRIWRASITLKAKPAAEDAERSAENAENSKSHTLG